MDMRYAAALLLIGCAGPAPAGTDLALHDLQVAGCAVGGAVGVQLKITLRRLEAREVELTVSVGRSEHRHTARLPGPGTHALQMTFPAPAPGEHTLAVRAPAQAEEADASNNAASAPFAVRTTQTRVLYIEHPPRYEYRFLKNALIRDPSLLVHAWLTSSDDGFPQEHSRGTRNPDFMEPLQEMPSTLKELLRYDVIVVGDVDAERLPAEALKAFVEKHGRGLVVIAGAMNVPQRWKGTALADLLPVEPAEPLPAEELHDRPFGYRLTPTGRTEPVTRFPAHAQDADRNVEQWEDRDGRGDGLVGVRWLARTKARPGASVLVECGVEEKWLPVFVTSRLGAGRVFFSATDETWLWRYLTGDAPWFYPFWRQVVGWAAGE